MARSLCQRFAQQTGDLKARFCQIPGLPFSDILSSASLQKVVEEEVPSNCRDRIFPPLVTLSAFIFQVLGQDHSCGDAVACVLADRVSRGEEPCSEDTSPYCRARKRLPENLILRLLRETGLKLHQQSNEEWMWKGRSVKLVDGTTVSMPDTPENQEDFPQSKSQKPGLGFPLARLVVMISLATGAVLDHAIGPCEGKKTGEHALLRMILDSLAPGDVLLADRYYCSFFLIAMLLQKKVDAIFQIHASRKSDFRLGKRLGIKDHLITWEKPVCPPWMDAETYASIPDTLTVRETKVGGKIIISTFLDPKEVMRGEIGQLYSKRWVIEVDLRSIKTTMQMDILRCKTPDMVRKEVGVHLLAYNLIRTVMAQAASLYGLSPRSVSFKGTVQKLNAFRDKILFFGETCPTLFSHLLKAVAGRLVGNRPGRSEPRAVKRRPKPYPLLTVPRAQAA